MSCRRLLGASWATKQPFSLTWKKREWIGSSLHLERSVGSLSQGVVKEALGGGGRDWWCVAFPVREGDAEQGQLGCQGLVSQDFSWGSRKEEAREPTAALEGERTQCHQSRSRGTERGSQSKRPQQQLPVPGLGRLCCPESRAGTLTPQGVASGGGLGPLGSAQIISTEASPTGVVPLRKGTERVPARALGGRCRGWPSVNRRPWP